MAEPTAFAVSQMYSQLTGREVSAALATRPGPSRAKQLLGVYTLVSDDATLVVSADIELIGALGGALVGLPIESAVERIEEDPLDETLRDAMHEIMNISASLVITDKRAVFRTMHTDPVYMPGPACDLLRKPWRKTTFDISVEGDAEGVFTILYPH